MSLVDLQGRPLVKDVNRRQMKSGHIKKTPHGDVLFKLIVDVPEGVSSDDVNKFIYEYFSVGAEAFQKKLR